MAEILWDPYIVLKIDSSSFFTCYGYAPSQRRRCYNAIAQHNRKAAYDLLDDIAKISPQLTGNLREKLLRLATTVLCRRNHQYQANDVVECWMRMVRQPGAMDEEPAIVQLPARLPALASPPRSRLSTPALLPPFHTPEQVRSAAPSPPSRELTHYQTPPPTPRAPPSQSRSTTPARPTTTHSPIPRINPYTALGLAPDARRFGCVGHSARRGGRCGGLIARDDRVAACTLLDRVAAGALSEPRLEALLGGVASLVLCARHQGQAEDVVGGWLRDIDDVVVEEEMRRRRRRASTATPSRGHHHHHRHHDDDDDDDTEDSDQLSELEYDSDAPSIISQLGLSTPTASPTASRPPSTPRRGRSSRAP